MVGVRLFVIAILFASLLKTNDAQMNIKGRLLTSQEGCGISKVANTKIVGGQTAKVGAWPWITLLAYRAPGGYRFGCGGSLITSRHVLTAAHCINSTLYFVRLGEHDTTTDADGPHEDVKVVGIEENIHFIPEDMKYDIAILYLNRDVEFTDRIHPVCLPIDGAMKTKSFVNRNPFVAGWGALQNDGEMSTVLQQVQVPVLENKVCKEAYSKRGKLLSDDQFSKEVICAGHLAGGKDNCQGDSGGPLMLPQFEHKQFAFYQIGIVSYGEGCADAQVPSVYTNVAFFADWITKMVNKTF